MSPEAGYVLMEEIAPRLKAVISRIQTVGAEDAEELIQDAMTVAAKMLHDLEQRGKSVTAGNVAYYTILHMKSGRRSYSVRRSDVMSSGTQMDGKSYVHSLEEPAGIDPETLEDIPLGEMLAGKDEDPSMRAGRKVDWDGFLETHNPRYEAIVNDLAVGKNATESARGSGLRYSSVRNLRQKLADDVREYFGDSAIDDSLHQPAWRGGINADKERFACRAERHKW